MSPRRPDQPYGFDKVEADSGATRVEKVKVVAPRENHHFGVETLPHSAAAGMVGNLHRPELWEMFQGDGVVDRVVSGNLLYCKPLHQELTIAITPDHLRLQQQDGSLTRYKGEPLSSLGIGPGTPVTLDTQAGTATVTMGHVAPTKSGWFKAG